MTGDKSGVKEDGKPPHRQGKPIAASFLKGEKQDDSSDEGSEDNQKDGDDTFQALFYDQDQAAAFKAGKDPVEDDVP